MKFAQFNEIAELVGTAAVVASLIFVGLQLQQTQQQLEQAEDIARTEMNSSFVANMIESNNAIIQNTDIWLRGNAGEELDPAELEIYERLILNLNEAHYYGVESLERLNKEKLAELEVAAYAAFLYENPGARRVWREREQWLSNYRGMVQPNEQTTSGWVDRIESNIAVFEELSRPSTQ